MGLADHQSTVRSPSDKLLASEPSVEASYVSAPQSGVVAVPLRAKTILAQLRRHMPFTLLGTLSGVVIMGLLLWLPLAESVSHGLFWFFHPLHVLLSALVTVGVYRMQGPASWWRLLLVGYLGSVGIATLSDCLMPYVGEALMGLPNRGFHLGFIEKWWLVNPLALAGIALASRWPMTRAGHAGHVLISTWASLFHITMALGGDFVWWMWLLIPVFLFLSVWVPCCTSDIIFPLLWRRPTQPENKGMVG